MSLLCCPGIGRRVSQTSSRGRPSAMPSPAQGQWKKVGLLQQVPGVAAATYILTITATYQGSTVPVLHTLPEGRTAVCRGSSANCLQIVGPPALVGRRSSRRCRSTRPGRRSQLFLCKNGVEEGQAALPRTRGSGLKGLPPSSTMGMVRGFLLHALGPMCGRSNGCFRHRRRSPPSRARASVPIRVHSWHSRPPSRRFGLGACTLNMSRCT